jgi:predicted nuclease with TOPRIM domain
MKYLTEENLEYTKKREKEIKKEMEEIKKKASEMDLDYVHALMMELNERKRKMELESMDVGKEYDEIWSKYAAKYKIFDELQGKLHQSEFKKMMDPYRKLYNDIEHSLGNMIFAIQDTVQVLVERTVGKRVRIRPRRKK